MAARPILHGTLQIGNGGTSGSIMGDVANNGTLAFNRSDNVTFGGTVSGSGMLVQLGSGILTLTADNTYSGNTIVAAGSLEVGNGGTSGSIAGDVMNSGSLAFNRADTLVYGGAVSGNGVFTKAGAGTLTLTGNSTYTGNTTVAAGTLNVAGSLGQTAVSVASGATLDRLRHHRWPGDGAERRHPLGRRRERSALGALTLHGGRHHQCPDQWPRLRPVRCRRRFNGRRYAQRRRQPAATAAASTTSSSTAACSPTMALRSAAARRGSSPCSTPRAAAAQHQGL